MGQNLLEITIFLTVSEIFTIFYFMLKFKMATKSVEKQNFSFLYTIPLYYPMGQYLLKIALSLLVSEIFTIFYFPLKSQMPPKVAKIDIFLFTQDTLVVPCR